MADTMGSIWDKLFTCNQKMFMAQEDIYKIRKMTFEEFKDFFSDEEGMKKVYGYIQKACDLNLQRQALILEFDKKLIEVIQAAVKGEDLNNGSFVQDQHKTY